MEDNPAKMKIAHACIELLNTTPLESLRTQDLIQKAGVSRSTFYRLFLDKFDVANWIYWHEAEKIVQGTPKLKDWKEWTRVTHAYMRKHKQFFRNLASYQGQNSFGAFLREYFACNTLNYRTNNGTEVSEDQRYAIYAFSLIGAQSTIDWLQNDCQPDDETIIRRNEMCIPECIRSFYE